MVIEAAPRNAKQAKKNNASNQPTKHARHQDTKMQQQGKEQEVERRRGEDFKGKAKT